MPSTSSKKTMRTFGAGALLAGSVALAAASVVTDGPDGPRASLVVRTRVVAPTIAAPSVALPPPARVTPAVPPAAQEPEARDDDPRALLEALRQVRAGAERPAALTQELQRALELRDLDLAAFALDFLSDVDPAAFRTTMFDLLSRTDGDTVVLGAALLSVERLQGGDLPAALEAARRSQWTAVQALSRRADASAGELEQRRGYVRFAVDQLLARQSPSQLAARLLDARTDADERLLLTARLLDGDDASRLLAPSEVAALSALLTADLHAAAVGIGHDDHDDHDQDRLIDAADEASLRARIVVLASLPAGTGLAPLRGLIAGGDLPQDLAQFAAQAAAEDGGRLRAHAR